MSSPRKQFLTEFQGKLTDILNFLDAYPSEIFVDFEEVRGLIERQPEDTSLYDLLNMIHSDVAQEMEAS